MANAGQLLDSFRRWIGSREQPMGSNNVPGITDQPGFWDDAWCAMTCSVACRDVGIPLWTAAVAGIIERAKAGRDGWSWHSSPQVGDMVCWDWPGGGRTDHVGVVESIRGDGMLVTIEGNKDDQCMRVVRHPSTYVIGYARPPFGDSPGGGGGGGGGGRRILSGGDSGGDVREAQEKLNAFGYGLEVDGDFGEKTAAAVLNLQHTHGLGVDGEIGPQTWAVLDAGPGDKPAPPPPPRDLYRLPRPAGAIITLTSMQSGLVTDIGGASRDNGAGLIQWFLTGGDNQRIGLVGVEGRPGVYMLVVLHSGLVLDVDPKADEGTVVKQWEYHGGDNQHWRLEAGRVISVDSGMVLDVRGGSLDPGTPLQVVPPTDGNDSQVWVPTWVAR